MNEADSQNIRSRVLEQENGTGEVVKKREFDGLFDCYNEDGSLPDQAEAPPANLATRVRPEGPRTSHLRISQRQTG